MSKFIISTDSSSDLCKDYLNENHIYCIIMKRIQNGKEYGDLFNSEAEFDSFYEELKKGALPSTTQLNSYELEEHFESILEKEKEGDILHIALSSGLSGTYDNARATANEINRRLKDRKIYVVDSLVATGGITMLIDKAIEMRDNSANIQDTIKRIEQMRDCLQGWVIVTNLFHLKRGGRISGIKAALGTILGIRPIVTITKSGRLAIENTIKGSKKAIQYVMDKIEDNGVKVRPDFFDSALYVLRTSKSDLYNEFLQGIKAKYPQLKVKELIVGPIVGTHLGDGCAIAIFEGAKRPDLWTDGAKSTEERINEFLTVCFNFILNAEEKALAAVTGGEISLSEVHVIEAVIKAQASQENNFSSIAKFLDITLGTLTKSYNKLENKGYLKKQQDETDKRVYYIIPTEIAMSIEKQHVEFHKKMVKSISQRLPKKSLNSLADALDALSKFFNETM